MKNIQRNSSLLWTAGSLLGFVILCAFQWADPAIEDEILIHEAATLWLIHGATWFELAHTPTYLELLSIWQKIWGPAQEGIAVLRSFGTWTSIGTALIFFWGLRYLPSPSGTLARFPAFCVALLIFHPLFVQSSLLLDYDATVQTPALLAWVILAKKWDSLENPSWKMGLGLGALLGLSFLAKELTPIVLMGIWPVWAITRKWRGVGTQWKRHLAQSFLGILLGLGLFYLCLELWASIRGFQWYDPLLQSQRKFLDRGDSGGLFPWEAWGWSRFLFLSYLPYLWLGVPFFFVLWVGRKVFRPLHHIPLPLWIGLGIWAMYTWAVQTSFYYPKYTHAVWPLFLFGLSRFIPVSHKKSPTSIIAALLLFTVGFTSLFDPIAIVEMRRELSLNVAILHLVSWVLPLGILWWIKRKEGASSFLVLALIAYCLGVNVRHASSSYETRYLYGESGFQETLEAVLKKADGRKILSAARDLEWQLRLKSYPSQFVDTPKLMKNGYSNDLFNQTVLVSRTYGLYSVAHHKELLRAVETFYRCTHKIDTPGERFQWWWNPRDPQSECRP